MRWLFCALPVCFLAIIILACGSSGGNSAHHSTMSGATDVVTYHNDLARTGQNLTETVLTPSNVNSASFGKLGFFSLDGKVDAEPLLLAGIDLGSQGTHDVLYVATEHDSVYAMDAATGPVYWRRYLQGSGETTSDNHRYSHNTETNGNAFKPYQDY